MFSERTINRLRDMVEDARCIAILLGDMSLPEFLANERTIFSIKRLLQRITQAAVRIDPDEMSKLGSVLPVAQMQGLGNRVRQEYCDIDRAVIFDIAQIEVSALLVEVELALEELSH